MIWIQGLFLALPLITQPPTDLPSDESEFGYYYGEFMTYAMEDNHPMAKLIVDRLADSIFQASSGQELKDRLQKLKADAHDRPDFLRRFMNLDSKMKLAFNARLTKAKQKRLIYSAAGALVGAVIGLPVGKLVASHTTLGIKVLWISVPAGALLGAGAGFLFGQILEMPPALTDKDFMSNDLQIIREEIGK